MIRDKQASHLFSTIPYTKIIEHQILEICPPHHDEDHDREEPTINKKNLVPKMDRKHDLINF